jgi:HEAT repeat protein
MANSIPVVQSTLRHNNCVPDRMTPILLILTLVSTMFSDCVAQRTSDSNGQPATVGELLQKHNIELSRPSLLRALKNSNPDVRYLAAMKLAGDKDVDTIPAIEGTLFTESLPRNRVNIALALGLLGDHLGRDELKKACADADLPSEYRMSAARYMFDLGNGKDEGCLRAAEEVVQLVDSENLLSGDRISALELLP